MAPSCGSSSKGSQGDSQKSETLRAEKAVLRYRLGAAFPSLGEYPKLLNMNIELQNQPEQELQGPETSPGCSTLVTWAKVLRDTHPGACSLVMVQTLAQELP